MTVRSITLHWFRGSSNKTALETDGKSVTVYGRNGSGKSSLVDAIEYALCDGKLTHLSHEYSGRYQQLGIVNTHRPSDETTWFEIETATRGHYRMDVATSGAPSASGASLTDWDYRRTVLRQDEVANFIRSRKGEKYSELLPLLGLHHLEVAAENVRLLHKSIEARSKLHNLRSTVESADALRATVFGGSSDEDITARVMRLHDKYCGRHGSADTTLSPSHACTNVTSAIDGHIDGYNAANALFASLQAISTSRAVDSLSSLSTATKTLHDSQPLLAERLDVLTAAERYSQKLPDVSSIECPACGSQVLATAFSAHVHSEKERLEQSLALHRQRRGALNNLIQDIQELQRHLGSGQMITWIVANDAQDVADAAATIRSVDTDLLRDSPSQETLDNLKASCTAMFAATAAQCGHAPPDVKDAVSDRSTTASARSVLDSLAARTEVARLEDLLRYVSRVEYLLRARLRNQARQVISDISEDIGIMWRDLHPGEAIEDVRLHIPSEDKAIDIALKFYGIDQDSPRLTLSEGYRNSLGLCIFLAMAKRGATSDQPLVLDDVMLSLDRQHRGMLVGLLERHFSDRQVLLFTHDRDWYTELRQQLDSKKWIFKALLPYESPSIGIRWARGPETFADAKALVTERPDAAGNDARKIMDVELSIIAEKLYVSLPYLRGDKNDRRGAHEFLERLVSLGKRCLEIGGPTEWTKDDRLLETLSLADRLLVSWGNRGSHSFDVMKNEADALIAACESALSVFRCERCSRPIYFSDASASEWLQCQCGHKRWRYGKA